MWYNHTVYETGQGHVGVGVSYVLTTGSGLTNVGSSKCADPTPKLIMYNHGPNDWRADAIVIDGVSFTTNDGTFYGIDGMCISTQLYTEGVDYGSKLDQNFVDNSICGPQGRNYHSFCIDNDLTDCGPDKQILYFDESRPNEIIHDAIWAPGDNVNGLDLDISTITCTPTSSPIPSISPTSNPVTHYTTHGIVISVHEHVSWLYIEAS